MRRSALLCLIAGALVLALATPAIAQSPPDPGRYELEWSELHRGQQVDLTTGVRTVDVQIPNPGEAPPDGVVVIRDGVDLWYVTASGQLIPASGPGDGDLVDVTPGELFYMQAEYGSQREILFTAVGRRVASAPPPAPAPLRVFMTQPQNNQTVSGTAWVVLWVEGTSGSSNVFTLSADGTQVGTSTTSSRGPVSLPWNTRSVANGTHTLRGAVRDAAGNTGSTSITVIVRN